MSSIIAALLQPHTHTNTNSDIQTHTETYKQLNKAVGSTIKFHNWPATPLLSQKEELSTYNNAPF